MEQWPCQSACDIVFGFNTKTSCTKFSVSRMVADESVNSPKSKDDDFRLRLQRSLK